MVSVIRWTRRNGGGPRHMRAMVIREHGGRDALRLETDVPTPRAGAGQAVVQVHACGLNHLDIFVRRGMPGKRTPRPFTSGGDIAGVIAELGPGASGVAEGQRVLVDPAIEHGAIGEDAPGGLAEYVLVPAANLIPLPDALTFDEAA